VGDGMTDIDEIEKKISRILDQLYGHAPNWVDYLRSDISTLIAKARELEKDKAGLVEALKTVLGWRELRDINSFPIERVEDIVREALSAYGAKHE